jgi:hypothetical protein
MSVVQQMLIITVDVPANPGALNELQVESSRIIRSIRSE